MKCPCTAAEKKEDLYLCKQNVMSSQLTRDASKNFRRSLDYKDGSPTPKSLNQVVRDTVVYCYQLVNAPKLHLATSNYRVASNLLTIILLYLPKGRVGQGEKEHFKSTSHYRQQHAHIMRPCQGGTYVLRLNFKTSNVAIRESSGVARWKLVT